MNNQLIHTNILQLLSSRNWTIEKSNSKFDVFIPPTELNFQEDYRLYVYNRIENEDFLEATTKVVGIVAQIYHEDVADLISIVLEDKPVLSLHIKNNFIDGKPAIPYFGVLIAKTQELLQEVANFSVLKRPHFFNNVEEAERYVNQCTFLKNETGSLITKIQLPNKEEIREQNLFDDAITGQEVNENFFQLTSFINREILDSNNFEPNDDFLIANRNCISVNVSNKLKELYTQIEYADIDISLKSLQSHQTTSAKQLNPEKVQRLSTFSKTVRAKMKEITNTTVYGKITQLKSKDVEGDKNSIIVEGEVKKVKTKIALQLDSEMIKVAADAFKNNQTVAITGVLEKQKSQYRVSELKGFWGV